ncbi:MAG: hypothetical protein ACOC7S_01730 [Planctomycetota bacterium]
MTDSLYEGFADPTDRFEEEPRAFCYRLAEDLVSKSRQEEPEDWYTSSETVQGILLLLFTWNYAARATKKLTHEAIRALLEESRGRLRELQPFSIESATKDIPWNTIACVFDSFKQELGQTGASKALSLLNPDLFVMWDTAIRKRLRGREIPGIANGQTGEHYVRFLKGIQTIMEDHDIADQLPDGCCLAKKIDEYHYLRIVRDGKRSRQTC